MVMLWHRIQAFCDERRVITCRVSNSNADQLGDTAFREIPKEHTSVVFLADSIAVYFSDRAEDLCAHITDAGFFFGCRVNNPRNIAASTRRGVRRTCKMCVCVVCMCVCGVYVCDVCVVCVCVCLVCVYVCVVCMCAMCV